MTSQPEAASSPRRSKAARLAARLLVIGLVTYSWAWFVNRSVSAADQRPEAASFSRGMLHGALMPGAMPMLLLGKDVVIYATNNDGRLYKLGYTFGVNACGALFFGGFYWRLNRWRKRA
jgi:hypothetical protein